MSRRARMKRAAAENLNLKRPVATPAVDQPEAAAELEVEVELETTPEPTVAEVLEEVQADGEVTEEEEDRLRQLAKAKGVSHWWSKSIDRIQSELAELAD